MCTVVHTCRRAEHGRSRGAMAARLKETVRRLPQRPCPSGILCIKNPLAALPTLARSSALGGSVRSSQHAMRARALLLLGGVPRAVGGVVWVSSGPGVGNIMSRSRCPPCSVDAPSLALAGALNRGVPRAGSRHARAPALARVCGDGPGSVHHLCTTRRMSGHADVCWRGCRATRCVARHRLLGASPAHDRASLLA